MQPDASKCSKQVCTQELFQQTLITLMMFFTAPRDPRDKRSYQICIEECAARYHELLHIEARSRDDTAQQR